MGRRAHVGVVAALAGLLMAWPNGGVAQASGTTMQVTAVAASPGGERVYAVGQYAGMLQVYQRNATNGDLTPSQSITLSQPTDVAPSADGKYVYVTDEGVSALKVFEVGPTGELEEKQSVQQGVAGPPSLASPSTVVASADNKHVYVADDAMSGGILGFERGSDGRLTYLQTVTQADVPPTDYVQGSFAASLSNVHTLAIAPNGLDVYASQGMGGAFVELDRDPLTGLLAPQKPVQFSGSATGALGSFAHTIAVSPNSKDVYSSQNGAKGLWWSTNANGTALPATMYRNGFDGVADLQEPDQVAVSPSGGCVVVNQPNGRPTVWFTRAPDGSLAFAGSANLGFGPGGLAFAGPNNVYAGSSWATYDPATCAVSDVHGVPSVPGGGGTGGDEACQFTSRDGLSINRGDSYTNDREVTLSLELPSCVGTVLVSNDGGFRKAVERPVKKRITWKLDDSVSGKNTKIVYVRPVGSGIDTSRTFTDDIILDTKAPELSQVSAAEAGSAVSSSLAKAGKSAKFQVRAKAKDKLSGVKTMQVAASKKKSAGVKVKYAKKVKVSMKATPRLFVRVRDGAGNWSRWRGTRVRNS